MLKEISTGTLVVLREVHSKGMRSSLADIGGFRLDSVCLRCLG